VTISAPASNGPRSGAPVVMLQEGPRSATQFDSEFALEGQMGNDRWAERDEDQIARWREENWLVIERH